VITFQKIWHIQAERFSVVIDAEFRTTLYLELPEEVVTPYNYFQTMRKTTTEVQRFSSALQKIYYKTVLL